MVERNPISDRQKKIDRFERIFQISRFAVAVFLAFVVAFFILVCTTDHPFQSMFQMLVGPFTSVRRFSTVVETAIPLTFCGLGICMMFQANQFNLAVEAAFYIGSLIMAACAILLPFPPVVVIGIGFVLAIIIGAGITSIPGYLKARYGASELVISLMLNTVLLQVGVFLFNRFLRDQHSAYATSYEFAPGVNLGHLLNRTRMHGGVFICLIAVVVSWWFLNRTQWGFHIRVVGQNLSLAKTVGISTLSVILLAQVVGGAIGALGGAVEMVGIYTRFQWLSLPGYGFDAVVLYILARGNPLGIPLAALLISLIRVGADYMYKQSNVASELVSIVEGLLIMLVAASSFLSGWHNRKVARISREEGGFNRA